MLRTFSHRCYTDKKHRCYTDDITFGFCGQLAKFNLNNQSRAICVTSVFFICVTSVRNFFDGTRINRIALRTRILSGEMRVRACSGINSQTRSKSI